MKAVDRSEVLALGEYEQIRDRFRARIIAEKRTRRLAVCPEISAVFENHDTVLFQIQEMIRTERISRESAVLHELETYNELIPGENELSATMFVEIPDQQLRERMLGDLVGLEGKIALELGDQLVRARNETRGVLPDRTTAVHYLKFPLGRDLANRLRYERLTLPVAFVLDHDKLRVRTSLPRAMIENLAEDLAGD